MNTSKRIKEKRFAESIGPDTIRECERIGIDLVDFCEPSFKAMQNIAEDLGL